jgi:hypothetical protein
MKKSILTLIAASVTLISVVHFGITNTDAASVQQKSPYKATNVNDKSIINPSDILAGAIIGNKDNSVRRGATPTQIVVLEPSTKVLKLHVGDKITVHVRLIRTDTGAGIPRATIKFQGSLDGNTWISAPPKYCLTTDSKGEFSYAGAIPDPHTYVPTAQLPITGYFKFTYIGDSTYVGSESGVYQATLLPLSSSSTSAPTLSLYN